MKKVLLKTGNSTIYWQLTPTHIQCPKDEPRNLKKLLKQEDFGKKHFSSRAVFFFILGFTPCKTKQLLLGMQVQEKRAKKRLKHTGHLFRNNLQLKDVC